LAVAIVEELRKRGIRADRAGARTTPPRDAILVKGQFVTVTDEGDSQHMALGLGPASSTLRIQVQSYQWTESGLRRITEREVGGQGAPPPAQASQGAAPPRPAVVISGGLTFVLRSQADFDAGAARL